MPRAIQSKESQVLGFFRTAPLVVALLVLNLAKEAVRERAQVEAAKAPVVKQAKPGPAPAAPKAAAKVAKPAKAKGRTRIRSSRATAARPVAEVEDLGGADLGGESDR